MFNFLRRNLTLKLLSLGVALLLWLYVTNEQAPVETTTRTVNLEIQQLRSDFSLVSKPDAVKVQLQGSKTSLSNLSNQNITAFADLSDAKEGYNEVTVQVHVPSDIKVLGIKPAKVGITVDKMEEKQVPVKFRIKGSPPEGYVAGNAKFSPSVVNIKGPSRYLKQINSVQAELDLTGANQDINTSLPLKIIARNIDLGAITVNPQNIQVSLPITKNISTKNLTLKYNITGTPADGFQVASVLLSADQITVQGAKNILDSLTQLNLEPIDISGANSDIIKEVKITLPNGVKSTGGDTVTVTVKITAKPGGKVAQ